MNHPAYDSQAAAGGVDAWLNDLHLALKNARSRAEIARVMDALEDHYDAFSGPGQEVIERMLEHARLRLNSLP